MKQLLYRIIYNRFLNFYLRNINKALYPVLPANWQIPPSGILRINFNLNKSPSILLATNQTNSLTKLIFWGINESAFEYTNIFLSLLHKIKTFYDVGANIGYYSVLAASHNPNIQVVSFEPAKGPKHYLSQNIKLNNLSNIKFEPIALSDKNEAIEFYEIKNSKYKYLEYNLAGEGNANSDVKKSAYRKTTVPSSTLDDYVNSHKESKIDLIKMDTEGTENLILSKSYHILQNMKPIVICETLYDKIELDLEIIMKSHGYEFFNHQKNGLIKTDSLIRTHDNGVRNCFFVHPTKYHIIEEYVIE